MESTANLLMIGGSRCLWPVAGNTRAPFGKQVGKAQSPGRHCAKHYMTDSHSLGVPLQLRDVALESFTESSTTNLVSVMLVIVAAQEYGRRGPATNATPWATKRREVDLRLTGANT